MALFDLQAEDGALPPLANGELVFAAPWQGRVFAMAQLLVDKGAMTWDQFREELVETIAEWEATHTTAPIGQAHESAQIAAANVSAGAVDISRDEAGGLGTNTRDYYYYDLFLRALELAVAKAGIIEGGEVAQRFAALEARPHGHDHHH